MDSTTPAVSRPNVVLVESTPRPTPKPARVSFGEVLAAGASSLVQGAGVALSKIPGSPVTAAAVRGSPSAGGQMSVMSATVAEGPGVTSSGAGLSLGGSGTTGGVGSVGLSLGGVGVNVGGTGSTATSDSSGGIEAALQQSAAQSLYYLQIQQQEDSQNRLYTAESNILKTEHDSAKNAIGNIHS